jgi:hypothetical protein
MHHGLHKLLTSPLSRLFEASKLETLEVHAVGFEGASRLIRMIVSLFSLTTAPRLRKILVKFSLHDFKIQQFGTTAELLRYLHFGSGYPAVLNPFTLGLLNRKLGTASCVQWEGDPSNVIGTATWQARKARALRESKELEDLSKGSQSLENLVRESIAGMEERMDECCPELFAQMMAMFEKENGSWLWY